MPDDLTPQQRAARDGWRPHIPCACDDPLFVVAGGDGYVVAPVLCGRCRGAVPRMTAKEYGARYADETYELRDPKHPRYHEVHADIWDAREGK